MAERPWAPFRRDVVCLVCVCLSLCVCVCVCLLGRFRGVYADCAMALPHLRASWLVRCAGGVWSVVRGSWFVHRISAYASWGESVRLGRPITVVVDGGEDRDVACAVPCRAPVRYARGRGTEGATILQNSY